ncbi:MAG: methionyl-tRNA formyltransferase [Patescibacteria group bacterium]
MILKIKKTNDPILREPVEKVVDFGFEFQKFIDDMVETMHKKNGVGLAAPQVGESKNVFICGFEGDKDNEDERKISFPLTVICNPKITNFSSKKCKMVEGCLSFPGMELIINRPEAVTIQGQDRYGKNIEIKADGLYARAIQHEYDHLNSTLLIDRLEEIKIIFIGTGTLGAKSLELLAKDPQYKILAVITGSEKKVISRNKSEKKNVILEIAKNNKLNAIVTDNIKNPETIEKIKKLKPELGVMADFGQIIPREVLDIPEHGVINIHPSLLPKHRGSSPIQQTILDGDKFTGVSLILTSEKMDAGDIISQTKVELSGAETSGILKDYLSQIGASMLLNSIPYYMTGDLKPFPQKEEKATYTKMIKPEDGYVDAQTKAAVVERKVRAFDQWPKVYTKIKNKRVQITSSHFEEDGVFVIDRVKPEGKKEMNYSDFQNGYKTELTFDA